MPTLLPSFRLLRFCLGVFLALAGFTFATPPEAVTYTDGDLFLGFRTAGDPNDYLVDLGPPSRFLTASSPITIDVGNISTDLSSNQLFGSDWYTGGDVFFAIIGGNTFALGNDPANTIYTSDQDTTPFARGSSSAQSVTVTKVSSLGFAFDGNTSTANSSFGIIQLKSSDNSYASFQPGGTFPNSGGASFATFSPSNELTPVSATAYLFRLAPTDKNDTGKTLLGTITISSAGVITFTPTAGPVSPTVHFTNSSYSVSEAGGNAPIALTRDGDTSSAFSVNVTTTTGTATSPTDYTAGPFTVNFASGATTGTAMIPVVDRANFQGSRAFSVGLSNATASVGISAPSTATVTITDDDAAPPGAISFTSSSTSANALDGQGNPATILVPLQRQNGSGGSFSVPVTVAAGGTLTSGTDFTVISPVVFADGATSGNVTVQLLTANIGSIKLQLGTPTGGATLGAQTTATVNVTSHGSVAFSTGAVTVPEPVADAPSTLTVTRANGTAGAVSIDVAVSSSPGSATSGSDYTFTTATLSWADGEGGPKTAMVTIKSDATTEPAETINFVLQNPQGGVIAVSPSTETVTIAVPDVAKPSVTIAAKVTGTNATISGVAKDNQDIGRVEIKLNGTLVSTKMPAAHPALTFNYTADIVPEQGSNSVEVTAFDAQGNVSSIAKKTIKFAHSRPELAGVYSGLLVAEAAASQIGYNGFVTVTITPTGTFSGKAIVSGVTTSIKGVFLNDGTARFSNNLATLPLVKKVGKLSTPLGALNLAVDLAGGKIVTGEVADNTGTLATLVHADLATYSKTVPAPASFYDKTQEKGLYTSLFTPDAALNNGYASDKFPQGTGYATLTTSATGTVKISGKLADGSSISFGGALVKGTDVPFYTVLYSNGGFISGKISFLANAGSDAAGSNLRWFKPAGLAKQTIYPDGWPNGITADYKAAKYFVPKATPVAFTALGLSLAPAANTTTANITVKVENGGFTAPFPSSQGSVSAASKVTILTPVAPVGLKVSFTAKSGAFSGSFTHPVTMKTLKFAGLAYQKDNTAGGYFLFTPPVGGAGTAGSGNVTVKSAP